MPYYTGSANAHLAWSSGGHRSIQVTLTGPRGGIAGVGYVDLAAARRLADQLDRTADELEQLQRNTESE